MNFFNKNRLIFWLLLVLVIINISALVTFFLLIREHNKAVPETAAESTFRKFRRELSLTPEQSEKVAAINARSRQMSEPVSSALREKRSELLNELASDHPDTALLNKYAEEIESLQEELQKASIRQYLDLRTVCDSHQCRKLSSFYFQLYGGKENSMGQGKRMQNRYRHGQRN